MLDQTTLHSLVHYDRESGIFTWRERKGTSKEIKRWNTRQAGKEVGKNFTRKGYLRIDFLLNGKQHRHEAHRLAWLYMYGEFPKLEIDHINRIKTDNRIVNFRLATRSQNAHNMAAHKRNKLGLKGIYWDKNREKFAVEITIRGKRRRLGRFENIEDAKAAYAAASVEYAKEFSIHFEVAA